MTSLPIRSVNVYAGKIPDIRPTLMAAKRQMYTALFKRLKHGAVGNLALIAPNRRKLWEF